MSNLYDLGELFRNKERYIFNSLLNWHGKRHHIINNDDDDDFKKEIKEIVP